MTSAKTLTSLSFSTGGELLTADDMATRMGCTRAKAKVCELKKKDTLF